MLTGLLVPQMMVTMKILLLNPPMLYGAYNESGRLYLDKSYPPLGLGYIAAILEKQGYNIKAIDLIDSKFEESEEILRKEKPQIVGISCNLTDYRWSSFKLAQIAKKIDPNVIVVMGGSHATHMYEQIMNNFPVDIIVRFEGELTFLELMKALETSSDLRAVKGIVYREKKDIVKNEDRPPIADLDSLPFPALHFFDFDRYIHYPSPVKVKGKNVSELRSRNIMASRGCPYRCQYCSIAAFWGTCRFRSVINVVDEIEALYKKSGVTHLNFFDDAFTLDKERVIEICREIIRRKLKIFWECVTRVDFVSSEMLEWMKKAGCVSVSYGVESGSPTVLKAVNKKQTISQIFNAFKMTHAAGIKAYILLMIGNPNETEKSINETIELIRLVKPDKIRTTLTMIYPATELYEVCKKKGIIDDDYWLTDKAAPIYTAENDIKQLKKWENKIVFSYLLQNRKVSKLFVMILYRTLFTRTREILKVLAPKADIYLERIDHILHSSQA